MTEDGEKMAAKILNEPLSAEAVCKEAARLVAGPRYKTHGNPQVMCGNIAALWNAYLGPALSRDLEPHEVAIMLLLLKIARTKAGEFNPDDYLDQAGYAGIACEIRNA